MLPFKIIYEDPEFLVLDKEPNLVVDSSETQIEGTLEAILKKEHHINISRAGIVHRLDKDTSGLLIVAKSEESLENLQLQFKERMVKKEYLALVHGFVENDGIITGAILRNPRARERFIVDVEGKEASTEYHIVNKFEIQNSKFETLFEGFTKIQMRKLERSNYGEFTLLRCLPQTGRTHQIRVHLKYINHPIVGDIKYAGRKTSRLDSRFCKRQFLHAAKIEFYHPKTGEKLSFESPLPQDLKEVLANLTKIND